MDGALNSTNHDLEKIKALQSEISNLRTKLDEKTLAYRLETRKVASDQLLGYGYGG